MQKVAFALAVSAVSSSLLGGTLQFDFLGRYDHGAFDDGAAEISAYDAASKRLFVINGSTEAIDVLDLSNPASPTKLFEIPVGAGGSPNSVAVKNGVVAVAVEAAEKTDPGQVQFYDAAGTLLGNATVGALPDMITFSPDGTKVLTANEGEPNAAYDVDPQGSVSIVDITLGAGTVTINNVRTAGFTSFDGQEDALRAQGIRIFGPGASASQDLEPEYVAVSPNSAKAYVTLQENNAIAIIDLATNTVDSIVPLGTKDHSLPGNGIDASDRDGAINIANHPVKGFYMPDAIASFEANGQTYYITANEGDAREYDTFAEEERINGITLDPTAFPNAEALQENDVLGRLNITLANGDTDGDGDHDVLHSFGGRSFSIWDSAGNQVFDSGDSIEQFVAGINPAFFNASNDDINFDSRSDNKGPEPEGVTIGIIDGVTYGFVGLERFGGVLMYDLTNPAAPLLIDYINTRDFGAVPGEAFAGDLGPEGLTFISAADSPIGKPMLALTNEISGTTSLYAIVVPLPAPALMALGTMVLMGAGAIIRNRRAR